MSDARPGGYVRHEEEFGWEEAHDASIRWKTMVGAGGTPTSRLTFGLAEIPPGGALVLHHHAPPEIYFILSGEGRTEIDGTPHAIRSGSVLYIPGDARHFTVNTGAEPLRFVYAFPTDTIEEIEYHFV